MGITDHTPGEFGLVEILTMFIWGVLNGVVEGEHHLHYISLHPIIAVGSMLHQSRKHAAKHLGGETHVQSAADLKGPTCVRIVLLGGPVQGFLRPVAAEVCGVEDPQHSAQKVLKVGYTATAVGLARDFNIWPGWREVITAGIMIEWAGERK